MNFLHHPNEVLDKALTETIRSCGSQAEDKGYLTREQLQIIYEHDWFRMFVPASLGGQELPLLEALKLLEAAAYAEGSFGWTLNLGAGANLFAAYIDPAVSRTVFHSPRVCIAGSGALGGTAEDKGDFFWVSGQWKYASGSSHATVFTANCVISPSTGETGTPSFRSFLFFPDEVTVKDTWRSYGLKASASHDFEVHPVKVPKERVFNLLEPSPYEQDTLYRFPFMPFAELTTALQLTGMAWHFIEEINLLLQQKKDSQDTLLKEHVKVKDTLAQAEASLESARAWLYMLAAEAWQACEDGSLPAENLQRKISLAARQAAKAASESASALYPLAGMSILAPDKSLNRIWRDLHTATQHILVSPMGFAAQSKLC